MEGLADHCDVRGMVTFGDLNVNGDLAQHWTGMLMYKTFISTGRASPILPKYLLIILEIINHFN